MDASQWFAAPKIPHKTSLMLQKFVGLRNTVTAERAPTYSAGTIVAISGAASAAVATKLLVAAGYEVIRLREKTAPDSPMLVAAVAEANDAVLVTMDGEFLRMRRARDGQKIDLANWTKPDS